MATHFVARNGDKLAWNAFTNCILQRLGSSQNLYLHRDAYEPSTSCKDFVNFSALNSWAADVSDHYSDVTLQEVAGCTHDQNTNVFDVSTAMPELSSPNFQKIYRVSRFRNKRFRLRRLAQETLLYNGNRFVARVGENWHTPSSFCALAFNNGWEYGNVDCCVNTADDSVTSDNNMLNFGSVTRDLVAHLFILVVSARRFKYSMRWCWFLKVIR